MSRRDPGGQVRRPCPAGVAARGADEPDARVVADEPATRGERGAATAEAAILLPVLVLVAVLLAWGVSLMGLRLQAIDAAREAARLVARGEPVTVGQDAARAVVPSASRIDIAVAGEDVRVRVEVPVLPDGPLRSLLSPAAGFRVAADAVAARERTP